MRRRDVGNEVVVALAAIGTLALALTFGIVLTISQTQSTPQPTGVQSVQATNTRSATALTPTSPGVTLATSAPTQAATQAVAQVASMTTSQATTASLLTAMANSPVSQATTA